MIGTGPSQPLLNEQPFIDPALQSCVLEQAAPNGWALASEVTTLDCADFGITDLTGLAALTKLTSLNLANNNLVDIAALESLSTLTSLDLTGNEAIACGDLDSLETQLGQGVVTRPIACDGGSGISNQRVQNLHNAMGQRAVKSVDGGAAGTIHFIYDQAGQVIAEIDAVTGMTLREYIYVNGVQVALVDDTGTQDEAVYFVHTNHLATPQKITDSAQTVVWSGSYEPFGEVEETVNIVENNIRFPGQYADGETGLHYNYFRDYDPSLGRYVESDPIGLRGGLNTFSYVNSNPLRFKDINGRSPQEGNRDNPPEPPIVLENPRTGEKFEINPKPPRTHTEKPEPPQAPINPKTAGTGCYAGFTVCRRFCTSACPGGWQVKAACLAVCVVAYLVCEGNRE